MIRLRVARLVNVLSLFVVVQLGGIPTALAQISGPDLPSPTAGENILAPSPMLAKIEPAGPALDLHVAPAPSTAQPSLLSRWWFWTAVGAAAIATATVIVISSRGSAPPATNLGNQEFQP